MLADAGRVELRQRLSTIHAPLTTLKRSATGAQAAPQAQRLASLKLVCPCMSAALTRSKSSSLKPRTSQTQIPLPCAPLSELPRALYRPSQAPRNRSACVGPQVQQVLEFSSDRGRMSVIYRMEDGSVRLFAKGSDAKMLAIMSPSTPKDLLEATNKNLHLFATQVSLTRLDL